MEHPQLASKTWELSLYELHRAPHEVKTDDTEIVITPRSLHSELMCPICLDMLKNTMTTKECLHRFCQECIITALRSGNKECPTCRKKLVSKRSLRPDPNFDALISKIFPSRDEYDAHQERVLAKIKQSISSSSTIQNLEEGLRQQVVARSNRVRKNVTEVSLPEHSHDRPSSPTSLAVIATSPSSDATPSGSGTSTASTSAPHGLRRSFGEVELVLQPHSDHYGSNMPTRFIKTTSNATIEHIAKYLAMRAAMEDDNADHSTESLAAIESQYVIYTSSSAGETPSSLHQVPATVALSDIAERLSSGKFKTLELRYHLR